MSESVPRMRSGTYQVRVRAEHVPSSPGSDAKEETFRLVVERLRRGMVTWFDTGDIRPVEEWSMVVAQHVTGFDAATEQMQVLLTEHDVPSRDEATGRIPSSATYDSVLLSGFAQYDWWDSVVGQHAVSDSGNPPADWEFWVRFEDPFLEDDDEEEIHELSVDHRRVIEAMREIVSGAVEVSDICRRECGKFLDDPDAADFDAATGDEVMQVAVTGEVLIS